MITLFEVSKFPLFHTAGNKMSLSLAPTEHLSPLFCIEEYLVELLGWVAKRTVVLNMNLIAAQSAKYFCVRKN